VERLGGEGRRYGVAIASHQRIGVGIDGPSVDPARRRELRAAIESQDDAGLTGLGLMRTDLVALRTAMACRCSSSAR